MFDFFKKRDYSNVIKFPEPVSSPYSAPQYDDYDDPPEEKVEECHYTVGSTDHGRVVLKIGNSKSMAISTLTMNPEATRQLIRMLEAAIPVNSSEERENE